MITVLLALGIVLGYAARQRYELNEAREEIEDLRVENRARGAANRLLLRENQDLRGEAAAHVSTIEMVLREVDRAS